MPFAKIVLPLCFLIVGLLLNKYYLSKHLVFVPKDNQYLYPDRNDQLRFPSPGLRWVGNVNDKRSIQDLCDLQTAEIEAPQDDARHGCTYLFKYAIDFRSNQRYILGESYPPPEHILARRATELILKQLAMSDAPFSERWLLAMKLCAEDMVAHTASIEIDTISVRLGENFALLYDANAI